MDRASRTFLSNLTIVFLLTAALLAPAAAQQAYYPGKWGDWEKRSPEQAGFDAQKLQRAIAFAEESFNARGGYSAAREPYPETIGPTKAPSGMNGLIVRNGYIVAEWGNTRAVDMTFSVTKTYLSTVAGLAFEQGLIRSLDDRVGDYVQDGHFDTEHNAPITWFQLLNQTSGWEGTLWGKPDWADRYRGSRRPSETPGQHWRYNDVRVNILALSLLQVWRRPLPQVLKEHIMDRIDASPTWRWHGYRNSWVLVDGVKMQSVSGGGHWGGGMFVSTRDHARFGLLFLRQGRWKDRQLISQDWIRRASTPTAQRPVYGFMNWFLNGDGGMYSNAPDSSVFFLGAGTNMIWLDPDHDMLVVVRWIQRPKINEFAKLVLDAIE